MIAAGKHGVGVLSLGAGLPGGPEALAKQWAIDEETAAKHGKTADRSKWRIVVNVHVADDDEQALREVNAGERRETVTYFEDTLGRPPGRSDDPLREGVKRARPWSARPRPSPRGSSGCSATRRAASAASCSAPTNGPTARQTLRSLRAVRALRHAALPGLARHHRRLERLGAREPQGDLRPDGGGGARRPSPTPAARCRTSSARAPSAPATSPATRANFDRRKVPRYARDDIYFGTAVVRRLETAKKEMLSSRA